jgi:sulfur carrier protein
VQVFLNGQAREIPDAATIADLLGELQLAARQVAVEVNLELVPRVKHGEHRLSPGDRLEVVTLVGGG